MQLRKIRRRSPHDDTEAFTVFLRSDVELKLVHFTFLTTQNHVIKKLLLAAAQIDIKCWNHALYSWPAHWQPYANVTLLGRPYCIQYESFPSSSYFNLTSRALDVWGSPEALDRERKLRKVEEREYEESRCPPPCKHILWLNCTLIGRMYRLALFMICFVLFLQPCLVSNGLYSLGNRLKKTDLKQGGARRLIWSFLSHSQLHPLVNMTWA